MNSVYFSASFDPALFLLQQVWSSQTSDASPPPPAPLTLPSVPLHAPHHRFPLPSPSEVENTRFRAFEKHALRTDGRTDPLMEMRSRI